MKRRLTEMVTEILTELRPAPELDLRVSTFALFGMMNWMYNWYRPDRDVPVERLADEISRLFLGGFMQEGAALPAGVREAAPDDSRPSVWGNQRPNEGQG
jgi:hypothetical protein